MGTSVTIQVNAPSFKIGDLRMFKFTTTWALVKSNCARVRAQRTVDGAIIEENKPNWKRRKASLGYSTQPLVMSGQMTKPQEGWRVRQSGEWTIGEGDADSKKKMGFIKFWSRGRTTWLRAYGIGTDEITAAEAAMQEYIKKEGIIDVKRIATAV